MADIPTRVAVDFYGLRYLRDISHLSYDSSSGSRNLYLLSRGLQNPTNETDRQRAAIANLMMDLCELRRKYSSKIYSIYLIVCRHVRTNPPQLHQARVFRQGPPAVHRPR